MAQDEEVKALSEEFLLELFSVVFRNAGVCSIVVEHIEQRYLPDRDFQALLKAIKTYYKTNKTEPTYGAMRQHFSSNDNVLDLITDIEDINYKGTHEALIYMIEQYIKGIRVQILIKETSKLYNAGETKQAEKLIVDNAEWMKDFSLNAGEFTDIIASFKQRHEENRRKEIENANSNKPKVCRFYIDELDALNDGRNLRTQHTCFMASSGVGKSTIAVYIGMSAATQDGLNVLHIQLEGSKEEVEAAYSGALIGKNGYFFQKAKLKDDDMVKIVDELGQYAGTISVKTYSRFNNKVSTTDVKNAIQDYIKATGKRPDVIIVDSLDLLKDASGTNYNGDQLRHQRVAVACDLKDLAGEEDVWIISTYQSTIEDRKLINDPLFVLNEYNCSEAKGLVRPLTHLITLNQTYDENMARMMRLHVAKSRFFKKGSIIKIKTNYDCGLFYDRQETIRAGMR